MTTLKNLTPHDLVFVDEDGHECVRFGSDGVARVSTHETRQQVLTFDDGAMLELYAQEYGEVTGLPPEEEGVVLVVSGLVRAALPEREDLASPGGLVRDEKGRVVGCTHLVTN